MALTKLNARSATALDATILTGNLPAISGASLTGITTGATEVDQWMVTSQFTASGNTHVQSNWTRRSAAHGFNKIGTGVDATSGTFDFPSTGIWEITWSVFAYHNSASTYVGAHIYSSENDFSGQIEAAQSYTNTVDGGNRHVGCFVKYIFDVEDISTHKVRFYVESQNNTDFKADANAGRMMATFIRLGDTP